MSSFGNLFNDTLTLLRGGNISNSDDDEDTASTGSLSSYNDDDDNIPMFGEDGSSITTYEEENYGGEAEEDQQPVHRNEEADADVYYEDEDEPVFDAYMGEEEEEEDIENHDEFDEMDLDHGDYYLGGGARAANAQRLTQMCETILSQASVGPGEEPTLDKVVRLTLYAGAGYYAAYIHPIFLQLHNLEELSITSKSLHVKMPKIENLQNLTKLKVLDLSRNDIKKIENIQTLTNLRTLKLDFNPIASLDMPDLENQKQLEVLSLCGTNIKNLFSTCAVLRTLPNLRELYFHREPGQPAGGTSAEAASRFMGSSMASFLPLQGFTINHQNISASFEEFIRRISAIRMALYGGQGHNNSNDNLANLDAATDAATVYADDVETTNNNNNNNSYTNDESTITDATDTDIETEDYSDGDDEYSYNDDNDNDNNNFANWLNRNMAQLRETFNTIASGRNLPYRTLLPLLLSRLPGLLPQQQDFFRVGLFGHLGRNNNNNNASDIDDESRAARKTPICTRPHYREFIIHSLPQLQVLDGQIITQVDRAAASEVYFKYFEDKAYDYSTVEPEVAAHDSRTKRPSSRTTNMASCIFGRETKTRRLGPSFDQDVLGRKFHPPCRVPDSDIVRAPVCPVTIHNPRQFEYHPDIPEYMIVGTTRGSLAVVNYPCNRVVGEHKLRSMESTGTEGGPARSCNVLALCWLKAGMGNDYGNPATKFIAGTDSGTLTMFDMEAMINKIKNPVVHTFDQFKDLTSLHINCTNDFFLTSGYSNDVCCYDMHTGKVSRVMKNLHTTHINVIKCAGTMPHLFVTSSFDKTVKLWDIREKSTRPVFTRVSDQGNVMVCFSPDDKYVLSSAVDNEVRQYLTSGGALHLLYDIPKMHSPRNYTRSYYMNNGKYIIVGSCEEDTIKIFNTTTGKMFREVQLFPTHGHQYYQLYVQSLRGDPFRDFHFSVLTAYTTPADMYTPSEIVQVNLLNDKTTHLQRARAPAPAPALAT